MGLRLTPASLFLLPATTEHACAVQVSDLHGLHEADQTKISNWLLESRAIEKNTLHNRARPSQSPGQEDHGGTLLSKHKGGAAQRASTGAGKGGSASTQSSLPRGPTASTSTRMQPPHSSGAPSLSLHLQLVVIPRQLTGSDGNWKGSQ